MHQNSLSRRDFLKLLALIPASMAVAPLSRGFPGTSAAKSHVIVIVYDAWTARNTSLYGYPRATMPNLEKFAEKSLVYHRHYAPAKFTVPGTASLLTGTYPWKNKALSLGGQISPEYAQKQIFNVLSDSMATIGYAQNKYADVLLYQAGNALKQHIPSGAYNLNRHLAYSSPIFNKDAYLSFSSIDESILKLYPEIDGSLFLGPLLRTNTLYQQKANQLQNKGSYYQDKLPNMTEQFLLSDTVDGAIQVLENLTEPSFVYLHFYPPHDPYCPTIEFSGKFQKSPETLVEKPVHELLKRKNVFDRYEKLRRMNLLYDQYLASWDAEVARLYDHINQSGLRDNSLIFITSDHGEVFERGEGGHLSPLLNNPGVHIPLIVSLPDSQVRKDIHLSTSGVDLLPTIAALTGKAAPEWTDGKILPGLGGSEDQNRSVYTLDAKNNVNIAPLTKYSIAITKNNKRLLYYHYEGYNNFEFYDLDTDPEEMTDLYPTHSAKVTAMEQELLQKMAEISTPVKK